MLELAMYSVERIGEIVVDVQTELICFGLAFATHLLFFSKLRLPNLKSKKCEDATPPTKHVIHRKGGQPNGTLVAFKSALRAGDAQSALDQFEELHTLWQQSESPSCAPQMLMEQLVKLSAQSGMLSELLRRLAKLGVLENTIELVLAESAERGDNAALKEAQDLAREHGVKFTATAYQALIKGAKSRGSRKDAERFMSEARRDGVADVATYCAYVSALLKWGDKQEARKVMESMRVAGLRPTIVALNKLLDDMVTSNADGVWSIFDEMQAFGVKPDQVTCTILLKSRSVNSKAAHLEKVMGILDGLNGEIDEVLFSSIVDACVRMGRADLLKPFLVTRQTSRRVAVKSAHTYGSIIRAYGYIQDMRGAWDTWNDMKRQHIVPISVTLGCMVEALVTNGDVEGGYELIQEMLRDEKTSALVNSVMYGSIVKGFSHGKNFNRVWQVYDEMVSQNLQFSMVTYNTLIDTCARSGELARIPSLLKDIEAQGLKMGIVTYSTILKGYCQKNMLEDAFELFQDLEKSREFQPDEIMYNTLLDGCARQGLFARGIALFERMKKSGVRPSNYTLSVLVKLANRGRKLEKAFELCDELTSTYGFRLNTHVFANLVQACINHNDLPRAIGVLERMLNERVRPDVRSYSLLLRACVETRSAEDAAGLLRSAMGLPDPHPRLAKFAANATQPQGGLPGDLVSEILLGLADVCHNERLPSGLLLELSRIRGLKLDPKLRLRLAARMA